MAFDSRDTVAHALEQGERHQHMKPWELVDRTRGPDGADITLSRRDGEYLIAIGGQSLMSSRMYGSEEALATLACSRLRTGRRPHVIVGGLGMGFTLRAALDHLPSDARVLVAEVLPAVVGWNRGPLAPLADHPLDDPRVRVQVGDVGAILRTSRAMFDAILLDVDNGPGGLMSGRNDRLYGEGGVRAARAALKAGGVLAVWSASPDRAFENRLRRAGFDVEVAPVRGRWTRGPRHTVFLGATAAAPRSPRAAGDRRHAADIQSRRMRR